jgi:hypothetical protein
MATAELAVPHRRREFEAVRLHRAKGAQSFESRSLKSESRARSLELTEAEVAELDYLWHGYSASLGCRSVHGAIEAQLMRSPPRDDARRHVLEELDRGRGPVPEGKLVRIVAEDYGVTRYEVRRAVHFLALHGKVERTPSVLPEWFGPDHTLTAVQAVAKREWTGFDVRARVRERGTPTMRLALASVGDDPVDARWRRADEALEREWRVVGITGRDGGRRDYEPDVSQHGAVATGVIAAMERIPTESAIVLRARYGGDHWAHADVYAELGGIVEMAPCVVAARAEAAEGLAARRTSKLRTPAELLAMARREVTAAAVIRGRSGDKAFVARVKAEARQMLIRACGEYRAARRGR